MEFGWMDVGQIAHELFDRYPTLDPYEVPLKYLADMVVGLEGFEDAREQPDDQVLFAIQQAWLAEVEDAELSGQPPEPDDPALNYPIS